MANYFTNFSFTLNLPTAEAQTYAMELAEQARCIQEGDERPNNFPKDLIEVLDFWYFETDADNSDGKPALWLHSDSGGIDAVCAFIQHLLKKFDPQGRVSFEWSHDCSKPRINAYGGGAAIITTDEVRTMNTCGWLRTNGA